MNAPPKPLDPPMVPFALGGIALWIVAALVMLPFRDELATHGHGHWFGIAIAGAIWGIPGLSFMLIHDRNRRRRRARAASSGAETGAQPGSGTGAGTSDSFKTDAPTAP